MPPMTEDPENRAVADGLPPIPGGTGLSFSVSEEGLSLTDGTVSLRGDFACLLPRIAPGRIGGESLVRAAKLRSALPGGPFAVDATAGLGEDSFLLAAAGFRVLMFEKDPVIAALLSDALKRASDDPRLAEIASRMTLVRGDSVAGMRALGTRPDIILLDPMFPERRKSGLTKKKMQLLGRLEAPAGSEEQTALLNAATAASPQRIIIKRPEKGEFLGGIKPLYSIPGSTVRYDCIVFPV